ncbi:MULTISPECIES: TrmH family RNA methyltransferase [Lentihominibacter]|jgi:RNA methyltransferase, TrmH family|uniref:RNA methyltransferase n=1 Tax=Lentihominibacter hominis TaxID=2763645 RepID=A0A926E8S8_9FIRM|nr:RNA methyltransferase [Lentihominibacter hominis]MBC8568495.1 RNA methyltransferase [Lentihominibacter hominis]
MKIITSKNNSIYKKALRLLKKKYRDETGMYLLEGVKPLEDAFYMDVKIKTVFLREGTENRPVFTETDTIILSRDLFNRLSDTESSQGIIAVAEKYSYDNKSFSESVKDGNILIMDRLQDPGNIGTIIRTAEAAGYKGIIMMRGSGDVYSPKVVRAAAGSLFRMPVINADTVAEATELIKITGKKMVVTCFDTDVSCFDVDLTSNVAVVIGNEGQGVRDDFINSADLKIKIPMEGSIESLNAAVAAGILMYQSQKINFK